MVIRFYTLSAFNAAGDLCGFWTVDTYAALCSIPRIAGMTYVFDWVA